MQNTIQNKHAHNILLCRILPKCVKVANVAKQTASFFALKVVLAQLMGTGGDWRKLVKKLVLYNFIKQKNFKKLIFSISLVEI